MTEAKKPLTRRPGWDTAKQLTLRTVGVDANGGAEFVDQDGRSWSQKQVVTLEKQGAMKITRTRRRYQRIGGRKICVGRTLTVLKRRTVRAR